MYEAIPDAIESVLAWDLPDEALPAALDCLARLMSGIGSDETDDALTQ